MQRNKDPIRDILARVLPDQGLVLEIASGGGGHAAYFAEALPALTWQPSDPDADSRASIAAWQQGAGLNNLLPPLDLDVTAAIWPVERAEVIVCINMVHISPWAATVGLMAGAGRILPPSGVLCLYGPYKVDGRHTAPSNHDFDQDLKHRNPAWGIRDLDAVAAEARGNGLALIETVAMPANNLTVVFRKD